MELRRHADATGFLAHAGDFLAAREAEHNLVLGLSSRLENTPLLYGEPAYLAVLEDDGEVVAAALRTPPHNLVLSEIDRPAAVELIAADVRSAYDALPGVVGPKEQVKEFVAVWEAATGAKGRLDREQRAFRAERVDPPQSVSGRMRPYDDRDFDLAVRWMDAFVDEALGHPEPETSSEFVERRKADPDGGLVIWEDGETVSMAGFGGRTPNGIRIGPVYTPPEQRRRGYGSALTAALTEQLLDGGKQFCFLFTDLANPTSNRIYQQIGYRPVADIDLWAFT
jgi:predicted GNAT family acetyltransferase